MAYFVEVRPAADKVLTRLPSLIRGRLQRAINSLATEPRPPGVRQVAGRAERTYRIRVGDYRVLYEIEDERVLVIVVTVGHRGDIYRLREDGLMYVANAV